MSASGSFKHAFLKHMLIGIKLTGAFSNNTSFEERKQAIGLSANAAMALARGSTYWSRAVIAKLSKHENDKAIVKSILGKEYEKFTKPHELSWKIRKSKVLRRSTTRMHFKKKAGLPARTIARKMVKRRAQVLKRLIPGGESLVGFSLLDETLDYAIYLRAQVDLMQSLTKSLGAPTDFKEVQEIKASIFC